MRQSNSSFSEENQQNTWNQSERPLHLRAIREENSTPYKIQEDLDRRKKPLNQSKNIRNLGFFKEQERQFTQSEDEEEWQERQSPINFVLMSCFFIVFCVIGWFGYRWVSGSIVSLDSPPLIRANPIPTKVRAENPGGMIVPHTDKLIYDRIASSPSKAVEHLRDPREQEQLLPPPEEPVSPPFSSQELPKKLVDEEGRVYYAYLAPLSEQPQEIQQSHKMPEQGGSSLSYNQQPVESYPPHEDLPSTPSNGREPRPEEKFSSKESKTSSLPPGEQKTTPVEEKDPSHQSLSSQKSKNVQKDSPQTIKEKSLNQLIEKEIAPFSQEEPRQKGGASYKIYVANFDSRIDAEREIKRIKSIDKMLFRDKALSIERIPSVGGKRPTYKVMIHGFDTPNLANQFSNKLKVHKVKGIVVRQPT